MTKWAVVLLVLASLAVFFRNCFLPGWTSQTTDFPNYYTAAILARHRAPLRLYYDWTWFQHEIDSAGIEGQPGGYIPQTPLTMIPFLPLSGMKPQVAKRCWLGVNLFLLALTIGALWRITGISYFYLWLLTFAGYTSLRSNFILGQYYVLLLFLLTVSVYCLARRRDSEGGALAGTIFGLKLYSAPFFLYFLAKRKWRAAGSMLLATVACALLAIALFGWSDVVYYATQVLPRTLEGETLNPFHPGNGSLSTLLRRTLMAEPELNPHPLFAAPALFFFLQPLLALSILMIPIISAASSPGKIEWREMAWLLIALLLASPNTASYTFMILVLPVALLLHDSSASGRWCVLVPFILIGSPLIQTWSAAFPKLWLLLILFIEAGWGRWKAIPARNAFAASVLVILASGANAWIHLQSYRAEPGRRLELAVRETGEIYAGSPVVTRAGILYQAIGPKHYLLRRSRNGVNDSFPIDADAFSPAAPDKGAPVYFEAIKAGQSRLASVNPVGILSFAAPDVREPAISHDDRLLAVVSHGSLYLIDGSHTRRLSTPTPAADPSFTADDRGIVFSVASAGTSQIYLADLRSFKTRLLLSRRGHLARPSLSLDAKRLLFASDETGPWQISVAELADSRVAVLTGGRCNNTMPAWALRSDEIVFASDCGRGLGLPALYRLKLSSGRK